MSLSGRPHMLIRLVDTRPSRVAENATSGIPSYGSFELHFVTRSVAIDRACSLQEHTLHQHFLMERIPRITQDT